MYSVIEHLRVSGYAYTSPISDPLADQDCLNAIRAWEKLRRLEPITGHQARTVYRYMRVGEGYKRGHKLLPDLGDDSTVTLRTLVSQYGLKTTDIWHKALTLIPEVDREYLISLLRRKEVLTGPPRIRVSTIHGIKGGEEDNVLVVPDMTHLTQKSMDLNPDAEHRVWYVAVTRAKDALYLLAPRTNIAYELWM
jgi:hypothetical protein